MKFTLSWLREHLDTTASVAQIAEALTDLGLEVEQIVDPADRLFAFKLGKVVRAEKHPDADKLQVCHVETGDGEAQIICGAPNARAGIMVVVAQPGTYVPGIDTTIKVGKIRGVESFGMMCSERELELSEAHEGIIELASGEIGQPFADWLAENDPAKVDAMIEIAITPNRADALGVRGIARDLAARGIGQLKAQKTHRVEGQFPCPINVSIATDTTDACPHFTGRLIRDVKNGPSPAWLQDRLRAIGLRPISALVDITNFFTFDQNRPLHVFDADKVKGALHVYRAAGGEPLMGLDDKEHVFGAGHMIIGDDNGPQSIAGIMGGAPSGVSNETVNVFLESAFWDHVTIAKTGRALKINTDARYRFERGVDPAYTRPGLESATQMILDLCGGTPSHVVEAGQAVVPERIIHLDTQRVQSLVGMEISPDTQHRFLRALGFDVDGEAVRVPSWRPDISVQADLVEEVARLASLSLLEPKPLARAQAGVPKPILTHIQRRTQIARRQVASLGYHECLNYSFIDAASAEHFGGAPSARLENPISAEMSHMRPDLLPGLLQAASRNQARGLNNLALFEIGPIWSGGAPEDQHQQIAGLMIGATGPSDVHGEARSVDVFDAKADLEQVLAALGAPEKTQILTGGASWWHPGQHGQICLGPKKILGVFGSIHPKTLAQYDVKGPAVAFTLSPDAIPLARRTLSTRPALIVSDLQTVERDFAFVVAHDVTAVDLINAAMSVDKNLISDVRIFDQFVGGDLPVGQKSLAIAVCLQPREKTLTDAEIDAIGQAVVAKVVKATGGHLRA